MTNKLPKQELLDIMNDVTLDVGERDDIILYFSEEGDEDVLDSIYELGSNPKCDDDVWLASSCGEAIGMIMCRCGNFQLKYLKGLINFKDYSALAGAIGIIKLTRPQWHDIYLLEKLKEQYPEKKYTYKF